MRKWGRRLLWIVGSFVVAGAVAWYPLILHSPEPRGEFPLDLAQVRALANSLPGDKPHEIRYEEVAAMKFVEALQMAGDPWRDVAQTVYAYQLVTPQQTIVVDTALARAAVQPAAMLIHYDEAAYGRVTAALESAAQIVVTHEHFDHAGGLAAHPRLAAVLPRARLTPAQIADPAGPFRSQLPEASLQGYAPLRYEGLAALAPGVVLIEAPGHTPGSQMVYVQRADGREVLFLGDVAWRLRNVEQVRERPLLVTLVIGEDRQQVLGQFVTLNGLMRREPGIALVPGHEKPVVDRLAAEGLLAAGFR